MINFLIGAAGMLAVLGLLVLGAFFGWKARERFQAKAVQEVSEAERRRFEAEQQAFESMLNYNVDTAYGLTGGVENMQGGS
jgi:predicted negative regulator of RcsB-dependent stress response